MICSISHLTSVDAAAIPFELRGVLLVSPDPTTTSDFRLYLPTWHWAAGWRRRRCRCRRRANRGRRRHCLGWRSKPTTGVDWSSLDAAAYNARAKSSGSSSSGYSPRRAPTQKATSAGSKGASTGEGVAHGFCCWMDLIPHV